MSEDAVDAGAGAADPAALPAGAPGSFGGLGPAGAARLRWERKRAQDADAQQTQAAHARSAIALVRVAVETGKVIDRLAQDAKQGNVQAARELREWLAKVEQETDLSVSALDRETRQRMKARLLAELAEGHTPSAPMPDGLRGDEVEGESEAHGAMGEGAGPEGGPHPADAGTPDDATRRGSNGARETATGMSEGPRA